MDVSAALDAKEDSCRWGHEEAPTAFNGSSGFVLGNRRDAEDMMNWLERDGDPRGELDTAGFC